MLYKINEDTDFIQDTKGIELTDSETTDNPMGLFEE